MVHLGINQDRYDSGVALVSDGRLLYAANEERFTRTKNQGGFPYRSLAAALRSTGVTVSDIERICVAGLITPPLAVRVVPGLHGVLFKDDRTGTNPVREWLVDYLAFHTPMTTASEGSLLGRLTAGLREPAVRLSLPRRLRGAPIEFAEHHSAHAAGARFVSGFDQALCVTVDGCGDGLSLTVSRWQGKVGQRLSSAPLRHSVGLFYEQVTQALGFIPNRHEGKVTGLAAHGDWTRVDVPSPFSCGHGELSYSGMHGRQAVRWLRDNVCARYSREDVASWAQRILEQNILEVVRFWLCETGLSSLAVAGGVFANVKLNQRLNQLPEIAELFVLPNMGDGGLAAGAIAACGGLEEQRLSNVFLGDTFEPAEIAAALAAEGLAFENCADIDARVAELIAAGHLVARFRGPMEWGPRALGNRSVLAPASDARVVSRLNRSLQRSDFMPFAPAVLAEDADAFFCGLRGARHAAEFMTLCFDATARMRRDHPAVVHVDGSVRAQLVSRTANPSFHHLLNEYKRLTGAGVLLNTSFNLHEEPIVRSPAEAISAFRTAELDYLAIGDLLVRGAHLRHESETASRPALRYSA